MTVQAALTACLGVVALASGLQGMLFCRCGWAERAVLLVVAFLSIDPNMVTDDWNRPFAGVSFIRERR